MARADDDEAGGGGGGPRPSTTLPLRKCAVAAATASATIAALACTAVSSARGAESHAAGHGQHSERRAAEHALAASPRAAVHGGFARRWQMAREKLTKFFSPTRRVWPKGTATPTPRHAGRPVGLQQAHALLLGVRCADHDRLRGSQHHVLSKQCRRVLFNDICRTPRANSIFQPLPTTLRLTWSVGMRGYSSGLVCINIYRSPLPCPPARPHYRSQVSFSPTRRAMVSRRHWDLYPALIVRSTPSLGVGP